MIQHRLQTITSSVWVNGHHLGRYWNVGPQQTLYVPAEWLRKGKNEIVVLEMLKPAQNELKGIATPILNELRVDSQVLK